MGASTATRSTQSSTSYQTNVVGSRAVAQVIDTVSIFVLSVVAVVVFANFWALSESFAVLVLSLTALLYNVLLEAFWNGQTVGKRAMGILVRSRRGEPITTGQAVVRNLPAILWASLLLYCVALLSIAMTDREQRLFDQAAGTIVVRSY